MSGENQNSRYESITEFVPDGQSAKKVITQAKAAGAFKKIGDEVFIDREKLLNTEEKKYRRLTDSEKAEFHYQKYQKVNTVSKIDQIISKIEIGLENRYSKIDSLSGRYDAEKDKTKKSEFDKERSNLYDIAFDSELKLEAAIKRRDEIVTEQKSKIEAVNKRRQKKSE